MMKVQACLRMGMVGSYVRLHSQSINFGAENIPDDERSYIVVGVELSEFYLS